MSTSQPPSSTHPLRPLWEEQSTLLLDLAIADLEGQGEVLPSMVAFRGPQPLFLATLRPFKRGAHQDPIIEVGALAILMGADRIMVSLAGRAWSTADPIPPVIGDGPDGDMRQRVVVVHQVDCSQIDDRGADPVVLSTLLPVDVTADGTVRTGPVITDEAGVGWVAQVLVTMVSADRHHRSDARLAEGLDSSATPELGQQILRCERLGHRLAWSRDVADLVERARMAHLDRP